MHGTAGNAGENWREALEAMEDFPDPRAEHIREPLTSRLDGTHSG
ncbi:hypothetical protein GCM10009642_53810 [Nocardiopsis metallicus]|uniref:Uncharacterized protein n=1 Tax=Nocardiopsis metallicus TaxID=179819 RepID=A0A840W2S4_9ACTN|nr:hypothetical protein [Nocardiopsis metallicus]